MLYNSTLDNSIVAAGEIGFTLLSGTNNNSYLRKNNNTGRVDMHLEATGISTDYTSVSTSFAEVIAKYRPKKSIKFWGIGNNGTSWEPILLSVTTDGYIYQVYSSNKTYTDIYFDIFWYIDLNKFSIDY